MSEAGAQHLLEPRLWRDEEIVWCDQPLEMGPVARAAARRGFYASLGAAGGVFAFSIVARRLLFELTGGTDIVVVGLGAVAALAVLGFGAVSKWSRARVLAHLTAYGVTNRRILMVRGEEEQWVGLRELERSEVRGQDVVVMRGKTATEQLWQSQSENRGAMAQADIVDRELVLAAVPDPQRVASIIQTLLHRPAS